MGATAASKVIASIATFKGREKQCYQVVESLLSQVDAVYVYRNSGTFTHPKVTLLTGADIGSNAKFIGAKYAQPNHDDLILICDDDIVFPADYVATIKKSKYIESCVISFHGRRFDFRKPIQSYKNSHIFISNFSDALQKDTEINVIGNGVSAFKTKVYFPDFENWQFTNCDDTQNSVELNKKGVKVIVLAREQGWLKPLPSQESIGRHSKQMDFINTHILNSHDWK